MPSDGEQDASAAAAAATTTVVRSLAIVGRAEYGNVIVSPTGGPVSPSPSPVEAFSRNANCVTPISPAEEKRPMKQPTQRLQKSPSCPRNTSREFHSAVRSLHRSAHEISTESPATPEGGPGALRSGATAGTTRTRSSSKVPRNAFFDRPGYSHDITFVARRWRERDVVGRMPSATSLLTSNPSTAAQRCTPTWLARQTRLLPQRRSFVMKLILPMKSAIACVRLGVDFGHRTHCSIRPRF